MFFRLIARVNFVTPSARCRRPALGRILRAPPFRILTRTTTYPCFALYPNALARSSLVGCSTRWTVGSRLHPTARCRRSRSRSFFSFVSHVCTRYLCDPISNPFFNQPSKLKLKTNDDSLIFHITLLFKRLADQEISHDIQR